MTRKAAGPLTVRLSPAQLQQLEKKYAKNNREYREEWIDVTPEKRRERRYESILKRSEDFYGRLTSDQRQMVRSQHASRAQRWEHRFAQAYGVTVQQQAALCVLMLRGAQTLNEIFTRAERIGRFSDAEQVRHALERLAQRSPALIVQLPRAPGQREERWMHLLCGPVDIEALQASAPSRPAAAGASLAALEARIEALEARLAALEATRTQPPPEI